MCSLRVARWRGRKQPHSIILSPELGVTTRNHRHTSYCRSRAFCESKKKKKIIEWIEMFVRPPRKSRVCSKAYDTSDSSLVNYCAYIHIYITHTRTHAIMYLPLTRVLHDSNNKGKTSIDFFPLTIFIRCRQWTHWLKFQLAGAGGGNERERERSEIVPLTPETRGADSWLPISISSNRGGTSSICHRSQEDSAQPLKIEILKKKNIILEPFINLRDWKGERENQ